MNDDRTPGRAAVYSIGAVLLIVVVIVLMSIGASLVGLS